MNASPYVLVGGRHWLWHPTADREQLGGCLWPGFRAQQPVESEHVTPERAPSKAAKHTELKPRLFSDDQGMIWFEWTHD